MPNNLITINSARSSLIVKMSPSEYADILCKYGDKTKEFILNLAGRILSNRRFLKKCTEQTLSKEDHEKIESLAIAFEIQKLIFAEVENLGYGAYIQRSLDGRIMPEGWYRILDRASEFVSEEKENVKPSALSRMKAMSKLGFLTDEEQKDAERISKFNNWEISASEDWGICKRDEEEND